MRLDNRRLHILAAIVELYIQTGEPVSSKQIERVLGLGVSSATIRNDMAALFDMGYLEQPHTSAGRVPSHLGYRIYIDQLMRPKPLEEEERRQIDALFNVRDPDPDKLLEDVATALADFTKCAAISATITSPSVRIRRIEIVAAGVRTCVVLLIASNGAVKNKVCRVDFALTPETVGFLNQFTNGRLADKSVSEVTQWYINALSVTLGDYSQLFIPVLAAVYELCKEINDGGFYTGGSENLLGYREFSDIARELLLTMNNKEQLLGMIASGKNGGYFVTIGKENNRSELADTSVVVTKYQINDEDAGAIGVIGPVRMDYARLIPHLEYFSQTLGKLLSDTFEQDT